MALGIKHSENGCSKGLISVPFLHNDLLSRAPRATGIHIPCVAMQIEELILSFYAVFLCTNP